jgi:hypothetical protein
MAADASASVRLVAEPKPGGVRWLARLDLPVAAAYATALAPFVPAIERALPPSVVANRVEAVLTDPPAIRLEPWKPARARFRRLVREAARGAGAALMADVRDCYGSITVAAVVEALRWIGASELDPAPIAGVLERLSRLGVRGLPIGPEPSAVLANAVLLGADRALAAAGLVHVRWVDDVVVFVRDRAEADRALQVLGREAARLGLALAPEKTRVLLDPAVIRDAGPTRLSGPRPGSRSG